MPRLVGGIFKVLLHGAGSSQGQVRLCVGVESLTPRVSWGREGVQQPCFLGSLAPADPSFCASHLSPLEPAASQGFVWYFGGYLGSAFCCVCGAGLFQPAWNSEDLVPFHAVVMPQQRGSQPVIVPTRSHIIHHRRENELRCAKWHDVDKWQTRNSDPCDFKSCRPPPGTEGSCA